MIIFIKSTNDYSHNMSIGSILNVITFNIILLTKPTKQPTQILNRNKLLKNEQTSIKTIRKQTINFNNN